MKYPEVVVLRLGHRPERDQRVTTHVGLAARAFGEKGMLLAAEDAGVVQTLRDVVERWGGISRSGTASPGGSASAPGRSLAERSFT